jgi:multidrug resistance efflux pump
MEVNEILENISSLRFFEGNEEQFWKEYLENISALSKSKLAIVISKTEENWVFEDQYIENSVTEELTDKILQQSIEMSNRALERIYAYEKFKNTQYLVSISLEHIDDEKNYVLLLLVENLNKIEFSNIILRAALCRDVPLNYQLLGKSSQEYKLHSNLNLANINEENHFQTQNNNDLVNNRFEEILLLLNTIIYESKFNLAAIRLVDEFANRFNCMKVSIGWESNEYIKLIAINQVEHFQRSSYKVKALEAIFEESYEQDEEIFYPEDENSSLITHSHKIYQNENKLVAVYSFPIRVDDTVIGVMSFEKHDDVLAQNELENIRLTLNYIAPTLKEIYKKDRTLRQKLQETMKESSQDILSPKNTLKKLFVVVVTLFMFWIFFGKMEYRVEAVANLQTDNISYISAPFDGIVKNVNFNVGDKVLKNQLLVHFDIQELSLKKLEINSDIIRFDTEIEKARATRSLADMKISQAKKEQSQISIKKIDYFLKQANIKAPFSGIIVEGDKEKLLGSPFSKGEIILQIANPTQLYARLKVLEQYIDELKVGQNAQLNLLSRPDVYFKVRVTKIIPMANVDDVNGNVFTLKVVFVDEVEDWMRPGMSGISKITIEDRSVLWILTHKISDYFHMNIWW